MLLLIDAGNTRIKWALAAADAAPGYWLSDGAVSHADSAGLAGQWQQALAEVTKVASTAAWTAAEHRLPAPVRMQAAWVSNVAGGTVRQTLEQALQAFRAIVGGPLPIHWFASVAALGGVRNGYREPGRLGCDRFAALIGARSLRPDQALIVATCGTATTVDALAADGRFLGGMILPGPGLMAGALARGTAQLPPPAPTAPPPVAMPILFADNTEAAIGAGCLAAQAGAIAQAVQAHGDAQCLLAGGAAAWIAPYLTIPFTLADNLVLIGLQAVASPSALTETGALPGSSRPC